MKVVYSSDGQQLTIADSDGTIRVLDSDGFEVVNLKGHQGAVLHVSYDRDMKQLFSVGNDQTIRLWNIEGKDRQLNKIQELPTKNYVKKLSFSSDGKHLATLEKLANQEEATVHLWNVSPSLKHKVKFPKTYSAKSSLAFSPDGKQLAIIEEKILHLWELSLGKEVRTYKGEYHSNSIVSFSPDGKQLAIFNMVNDQSTLHILNLNNQNTK